MCVNLTQMRSIWWCFDTGVMKQAIKWELLQKQYEDEGKYSSEIEKLIFSPELVRCIVQCIGKFFSLQTTTIQKAFIFCLKSFNLVAFLIKCDFSCDLVVHHLPNSSVNSKCNFHVFNSIYDEYL